MKIIWHCILTAWIFLIWAVTALSVINPWLGDRIPGYTMGQICIWDFTALAAAALLSVIITRRWGYPEVTATGGRRRFALDMRYGYAFLVCAALGVAIAVWQFIRIGQNMP